ncbi:MAG TPA: VTT domain-containing protein [Candidatus Nitrosotenuis sp.]|nr:VTT domain-containing protein [Candidatus Nitrosotenuis sp.]
MHQSFEFLVRHGYLVLFFWVMGEQLGLPVPAVPILLAAGALAGAGKLSLPLVVLLALAACAISDSAWFEIGRRRGSRVLHWLCKMSLEPDSCVRRTEEKFAVQGARSLVIAKFIPGLSTAAPPLAGVFRMQFSRFLMYDSLGSLLWAGSFIGAGYMFSNQLERVAEVASRLGGGLVALIVGGLAAYVLVKYTQRQRFLRKLRVARIRADELKQMLDAGENIVIVDLRHSMDFQAAPSTIPGALLMTPEEVEQRHTEIPRDRDIILYCT